MSRICRTASILLLVLVGPAASVAESYELVNGDRVTGTIVVLTSEHVVLETEWLGRIELPREAFADAAGLVLGTAAPGEAAEADAEAETPETAGPAEEEPAPPPKSEPPPATPAEATRAAGGLPEEAPEEASERPAEPRPAGAMTAAAREASETFRDIPERAYRLWSEFWQDNLLFRTLSRYYPLMSWDNQIDVGLSLENANSDQFNLDLRYRTEKKADRHQFRFETRYEFAESVTPPRGDPPQRQRIKTRDRLRSNARYRFDYVESFFLQSDTRYQRDLVRGIHHEIDEVLGIGYRWLEREEMRGSVTPGLGLGYRNIAPEQPEWQWLVSLQQDFEFRLTDRVKITEESTFTYAPSEFGNITFRLQAGLENQLNQRLNLFFGYDFLYDERVESEDDRLTQGFSLSFGAKF